MKKIFVYLFVISLLTACATTPSPAPTQADIPVKPLTQPATNTPVQATLLPLSQWTPPESPYSPSTDDANLLRGNIFIDSVQLTMEGNPPQFSVRVIGSPPTQCHQLRLTYDSLDANNNINISFYSVIDPNRVCAQVLSKFEVYFPLGSFPAGHYSLWINGQKYAEFDA